MSGDGLTDLVRIRNGEVCYWPNLGYGRFGAKVAMEIAVGSRIPIISNRAASTRPTSTDPARPTSSIWGATGFALWFNQSGNSWSARRAVAAISVDRLTSSSRHVVDLLGNGTACLVWSSPLPGDAGRPMRYVDLMGGHKAAPA